MAKCLVGAAGGLSAADKAKLIPENIREGVTLFEGTAKEVVGSLIPASELDVLATVTITKVGNIDVRWWNGSSHSQAYNTSANFVGTPKVVYMITNDYLLTSICGIQVPQRAGIVTYTDGFTNNAVQISTGGGAGSCVVLGVK